MSEIPVTAIILTLNEEHRIESALTHVRPYVSYIIVVDGNSTDDTVKIAKTYADKIITSEKGSFAEIKNSARAYSPDCGWFLWIDADERFDKTFLGYIQHVIRQGMKTEYPTICYRFPRINLPNSRNYPDYQVRLTENNKDIEWRGEVHETLYYIPDNIQLDQIDGVDRKTRRSVVTLDNYPIIHDPRREDIKREWW